MDQCSSSRTFRTNFKITRMHFSRIRTGPSLTVSRSIWWEGSAQPPADPQPPHPEADTPPWRQTPPRCRSPLDADTSTLWTEWYTGVKILPYHKLHLQAVTRRPFSRRPTVHFRKWTIMNMLGSSARAHMWGKAGVGGPQVNKSRQVSCSHMGTASAHVGRQTWLRTLPSYNVVGGR